MFPGWQAFRKKGPKGWGLSPPVMVLCLIELRGGPSQKDRAARGWGYQITGLTHGTHPHSSGHSPTTTRTHEELNSQTVMNAALSCTQALRVDAIRGDGDERASCTDRLASVIDRRSARKPSCAASCR